MWVLLYHLRVSEKELTGRTNYCSAVRVTSCLMFSFAMTFRLIAPENMLIKSTWTPPNMVWTNDMIFWVTAGVIANIHGDNICKSRVREVRGQCCCIVPFLWWWKKLLLITRLSPSLILIIPGYQNTVLIHKLCFFSPTRWQHWIHQS